MESDDATTSFVPFVRFVVISCNGDWRPLGIPTVVDRVIQQAIAQVLTPLFDPHFSTHSHGFRYGRRAHQAGRADHANLSGKVSEVGSVS